jgi:hypothetical protein
MVNWCQKAAAFIYENFTTNLSQVLICYLGGLFCFLPLFYLPSNLDQSILKESLPSIGYRYSSIATLALVFPILSDCITDICYSKKGNQNKTKVNGDFFNDFEKPLFLSGMYIYVYIYIYIYLYISIYICIYIYI